MSPSAPEGPARAHPPVPQVRNKEIHHNDLTYGRIASVEEEVQRLTSSVHHSELEMAAQMLEDALGEHMQKLIATQLERRPPQTVYTASNIPFFDDDRWLSENVVSQVSSCSIAAPHGLCRAAGAAPCGRDIVQSPENGGRTCVQWQSTRCRSEDASTDVQHMAGGAGGARAGIPSAD